MGAQPKRKTSKARRDKRRSHFALNPPALTECPQCHSPKPPHRVCPTCGTYNGRQVIEVETGKKKAG
jgi:large subunit ribosomal protein L32